MKTHSLAIARIWAGFALLWLCLVETAAAQPFPGKAQIVLIAADKSELPVGQVTFIPQADDSALIDVEIESERLTDHFLSMRPFRCIEGEDEWFCHQPYLYSIRNQISADDLTDLEYQLLFIRKIPSEFGIDAWNGLYYQLELRDDGSIGGSLLEGDLNVLQSPPAEQYARPIDLFEFVEADPERRLYPAIEIRPTSH